jgi:6-phosphogluconolactonase
MILWVCLAMAIAPVPKPMETLYIGTYTDPKGSKGIYRSTLNAETGELGPAVLAAEATAPSYLSINPDGKTLYAVNEYSKGEVSSFSIRSEGLSKLNSVAFDGGGPCHLVTDRTGKWLLVSAYGEGTLTSIPIQSNGELNPPADTFKHSGSGPNRQRQEGPHIHFSDFDRSGRFVTTCDLGTDELLSFRFNSANGKLTPLPAAKSTPGAGPRHFIGSKDGQHAFVANELNLTISTYRRSREGLLEQVSATPVLDVDADRRGASLAAIKMHPTLPILYISVRGANELAAFRTHEDGKLEKLESRKLYLKTPRDFAIDPSSRWMIVAGQDSNDLSVYRIDQVTGCLFPTNSKVAVPKPVCVVFAPKAK